MTTTTPMACGNCGNGLFRISRAGEALHAECTSCASVSIITTRPAELQIDWGENARGILCEMAPTEPPPPPKPPIANCGDYEKHDWKPAPGGGVECSKCGDYIPF